MSVTMHLVLVPTLSAYQHPYPEADRQPPKTHKKPEAIAAWRAEDEKKWNAERAESCVESPRESRVLMAGLLDAYGVRTVLRAPTEGDEPALLRAVWEKFGKEGGQIASWNGIQQCLTLIARSALHGITPDVSSATIRDWFRPGSSAHADVRQWLTDERHSSESLNSWAEAFDLPHRPAGLDANAIWKLVQDGNFADIETALVADLEAIHGLAQRIEVFRAPTTWVARNEAAAESALGALKEPAAPVASTAPVVPAPTIPVMPLATDGPARVGAAPATIAPLPASVVAPASVRAVEDTAPSTQL